MKKLTLTLYLATLASFARTDVVDPTPSDAILCLTNTDQEGHSSVASRQYTHAQGYDVCIKYQASTGTGWTWVYGATSSAGCAHRIQQSDKYRHVQCCMQDNCNMPDAVLDPLTQVAPPSTPTTNTPEQLNFDQPYLLTRARRARRILIQQQTSASARRRDTLTCYRNVPRTAQAAPSPPAVAPRTYLKSEATELCSRYSYKCSEGDRACSADDIKAAVWKWMYAPLSAATCMTLRGYSRPEDAAVKHVKCCSGTLCNRPDDKLDPQTEILHASTPAAAAAAATAAADKHQRSKPVPFNPQKSPQFLSVAASAALLRGIPLHVQTAESTSDAKQMKRLACYTSLPRRDDDEPAAATAEVAPRVYRAMRDGVCSRYQVKCLQGRTAACTAEDISSSSWVWQYRALSRTACSNLQDYAAVGGDNAGFRDVICCTSDNCNRPDPSFDDGTAVQDDKLVAAAVAAATAADVEVKPAMMVSSTSANSTADGRV